MDPNADLGTATDPNAVEIATGDAPADCLVEAMAICATLIQESDDTAKAWEHFDAFARELLDRSRMTR